MIVNSQAYALHFTSLTDVHDLAAFEIKYCIKALSQLGQTKGKGTFNSYQHFYVPLQLWTGRARKNIFSAIHYQIQMVAFV